MLGSAQISMTVEAESEAEAEEMASNVPFSEWDLEDWEIYDAEELVR